MADHNNKKADLIWKRIILPFLDSYVFPDAFSKDFILNNEPLKYGILGQIAANEGYKLCVEDVLASFVVSSPIQFSHIKAYQALFIIVAEDLVDAVSRYARKNSFWMPVLRNQKGISTQYDEDNVRTLFKEYHSSFVKYFSLFSSHSGVTMRVYYPSEETGFVDRSNKDNTVDIIISDEYVAPDGFFLIGYDYDLIRNNEACSVSDVVANAGKNYFAVNSNTIVRKKGNRIWLR